MNAYLKYYAGWLRGHGLKIDPAGIRVHIRNIYRAARPQLRDLGYPVAHTDEGKFLALDLTLPKGFGPTWESLA